MDREGNIKDCLYFTQCVVAGSRNLTKQRFHSTVISHNNRFLVHLLLVPRKSEIVTKLRLLAVTSGRK